MRAGLGRMGIAPGRTQACADLGTARTIGKSVEGVEAPEGEAVDQARSNAACRSKRAAQRSRRWGGDRIGWRGDDVTAHREASPWILLSSHASVGCMRRASFGGVLEGRTGGGV